MAKINMPVPLVEIDGDEMTRIIWKMIKDHLLEPYLELNTEYYDLGLTERNATDDQVTLDAALAIKKYGVGVKCATITPNAQRVEEYDLKAMWKSPNGTIREMLDGTVFRKPILVNGISASVKTWKAPITIARHAFGDIYNAQECVVDGEGKAELVITRKDGTAEKRLIAQFDAKGGVAQGMFNTVKSIESFAKSCFNYALDTKQDLWFATKDTISKQYHHRFKDIFEQIFDESYKEKFKKAKIEFFYTLIDDAVARVIRSSGGFIWACMNYDGDVMSDMVATAYGSLAMMTSVLVSPDGYYEYEAAHGTVTRHYYRHLEGEETSTNCMATLFAWTGALYKRGEMDENKELMAFANKLEAAAIRTIEQGVMTGDLYVLSDIVNKQKVNTEEFIKQVKHTYEKMTGGDCMSLYSQWKGMAETERTPQENKAFWDEYFGIETEAYKKILEHKQDFYEGKLSALAEELGMSEVVFAGFMDGINSSLIKEYDIEKLKESTTISLAVDFEKLYYNMLEAKARWLYTLPGWDGILSIKQRREIRNRWQQDKQAVSNKTGRNAPCSCGSGKKYKKCCGAAK